MTALINKVRSSLESNNTRTIDDVLHGLVVVTVASVMWLSIAQM